MPPLTRRRVDAIRNALTAYMAGEPNDGDELTRSDYEAALAWAEEQYRRRFKAPAES